MGYLRSIEGFIAAGCNNQSPLQREVIEALGLVDDFYGSLARKEYVYLVRKESGSARGLNALRRHYREVFNLELTCVEEPNLPYLYRLVFKRQGDGADGA
jgi:hypothetical protein